ncbi:MAG: NAD-dependent epimerase/dehydratase family protein [Caulobacteraceae bacterium]|nr:NAD-dependent epimerase/dehydratase family protein [Caulobacteraceae bacterium]
MRAFVTGATGYVGSAVIDELKGAGYTVLGVARTDEGAKALPGPRPHRNVDLEPQDDAVPGGAQRSRS